jgi:hypothetical protein
MSIRSDLDGTAAPGTRALDSLLRGVGSPVAALEDALAIGAADEVSSGSVGLAAAGESEEVFITHRSQPCTERRA